MKTLLRFLLKAILGEEEKFNLKEVKTPQLTIFTIKIKQDLIGKIIGKEGRTIKAIKNLLTVKSKGQDHFLIKVEPIS